ncbi:MAG: M14 family zinc carboxypeptidase [Bdellovibrionales bacterium]
MRKITVLCILILCQAMFGLKDQVAMRPLTKTGMWFLDTGLGKASVRDPHRYATWLTDAESATYMIQRYPEHVEVVHEPEEHVVKMLVTAMTRSGPRSAPDDIDQAPNPFDGYSGPETINSEIALAAQSPNFQGAVVSVGVSHNRIPIRGLRFSRCKTSCAPRPRVALLGGIHGDEVVGNEMLLRLIHHFVAYGSQNARLSALLDKIDLTIVPMLNPDGFVLGTRNTSQNYDLNRSFYPDRCNTTAGMPKQPVTEVEHIKTFLQTSEFDAVVFLHGGALVVTTPYEDECTAHGRRIAARGPEDKLYTYMGRAFADANSMIRGNRLLSNGVKNGAEWYSIQGSAQTFALLHTTAVLALTFEISSDKAPPFSEIQRTYWNANLPAFLDFLEHVCSGLYLTVRYPDGDPVPDVRVNIATSRLSSVSMLSQNPEREGKTVRTRSDGTAFRMLPPGVWTVLITHPGNPGVTRQIVITESRPVETMDIVMERVLIR